jgi:hypothetical protein
MWTMCDLAIGGRTADTVLLQKSSICMLTGRGCTYVHYVMVGSVFCTHNSTGLLLTAVLLYTVVGNCTCILQTANSRYVVHTLLTTRSPRHFWHLRPPLVAS